MKFAAIADVHGNCAALEAVLADIAAAGIAEVVNLGDHVSGPLEPRRTADLLMQCAFPSIRGNQDRNQASGLVLFKFAKDILARQPGPFMRDANLGHFIPGRIQHRQHGARRHQ